MNARLALLVLAYDVVMSLSIIAFKLAVPTLGQAELSPSFLGRFLAHPYIVAGVALALVTRLLHYAILTDMDASTSTLVLTSAYVVLLATSYAVLGERLSGREAAGCALILAGVALIGV